MVLTLLAVVVIIFKWESRINDEIDTGEETIGQGMWTREIRVDDHASLKKALDERDTIEFRNGDPLQIPTGFFIQSIDFRDANDVNVTGYIWLRFYDSAEKIHERIRTCKRQVIFPEEVNSGGTKFIEIYETRIDGDSKTKDVKDVKHLEPDAEGRGSGDAYTLIGWNFDVTLRQNFDYSKYPLDRQNIWLRVWFGDFDFDDQVILVPDLDSYGSPLEKKFGTDEGFFEGGWEIEETFFSYHNHSYSSTFGWPRNPKEEKYKELYFNVKIRRNFRNPFIINLIPLLVIAILLFAQLMTITGDENRKDKLGFNTSGTIATCSALFFVVMLAHIQIRSQFAGSGLVYLEYFYLIMYIVILLVSVNAYIFSLGEIKHFNFVYYHDNFISKVAFWPVVLWMMALITLVML